ncbi:MAG TPA: hypothetical protein VGJ25_15270 [Gaiellaceae bacterium]|jgi:hypothetical protein
MELVDLGPCQAFWSEAGDRTAVFLPGRSGGGLQPAFTYLRELLVGRGWSVLAVHDEFRGGDHVAWPRERALAAFAFREPALVVGKSMATFAAAVVDGPAVWLTPLLREPEVRDAIHAPARLVGGTADPSWDSVTARALGVEVLELDGVHHGLAVEGDAHASLDAMRRLVDAVAAFA